MAGGCLYEDVVVSASREAPEEKAVRQARAYRWREYMAERCVAVAGQSRRGRGGGGGIQWGRRADLAPLFLKGCSGEDGMEGMAMAFSAKAFLEGTRQTWAELKREQERLKEMESGLYEVKGASIGLGVHTYSHTDISGRLIRVEEQREKVIQLHKQWLDESGKAEAMIQAIHAPLVQCAMERRFILGDTWEKVAVEIGADLSYCYRLAKRGYREIEERQEGKGMPDGGV